MKHLFLKYFLALLFSNILIAQNSQNTILKYIKSDNYNDAISIIEESLSNGKISPDEIYQSEAFKPLFVNSKSRMELRNVLRNYPQESNLNIVNPTEEGDHLEINGLIVDKNNNPISGAKFYFFAVDNEGLYTPEHRKAGHGSTNPRLFGYVKTDKNGRFKVTTINPPSYIGLNNIRHVHFNVTAPNGTEKGGEFIFSKNPTPSDSQFEWAKSVGFQIIDEVKKNDKYNCSITIQVE